MIYVPFGAHGKLLLSLPWILAKLDMWEVCFEGIGR